MDVSGSARSPFSPRVRSIGGSGAGRRNLSLSTVKKNHSSVMVTATRGDVILKTQSSSVESYGQPLPVLVTETLTFANTKDVSARLSPNGWCWLVYGRKLLVWPYRDGKATCRELTLPQTDLAHKADLVCVFYDDGSQMPSCVGVSPEGVVRYWPSVAHESTYADSAAELQGQECDVLADAGAAGCVLATTTCTVVVVQPSYTDGRATVGIRTLRAPGGWLGGLGRRMSLLIFGSMPAQMVETKLVGVCVLESLTLPTEDGTAETAGPYVACVAAGPGLQLWRLGAGAEGLVRELELRRPLRELYCRHQLAPPGDINTLEVHVLDLQPGNNGLLLLTAACNPTRSPETRYALVQISLEENPRSRVTCLVALPRLAPQTPEAGALRIVECGCRVQLYSRTHIYMACYTVPSDKPDYVDLSAEGDCVLGAALCHGTPLYFTKNNGIVAVVPNDVTNQDGFICESPLGSPCPSDVYDGHLSLYEIDPDEISQVTTDVQGKLKTAFLYHVRRDAVACRNIIDELFPSRPLPALQARRNLSVLVSPNASAGALAGLSEEEDETDVDSALDRTVIKIAREMVDDVPAGDPRWNTLTAGESVNIPLGSSSALRILTQLRDKQKALNLFIDFLRATGLWNRLGYISRDLAGIPSTGGGIVCCRSALGQLLERLAAAVALRRMQQGACAHVIDTAVHQVIHSESGDLDLSSAAGRSLSPSDLFYKKVSQVERFVHALVRWCEEQLSSDALQGLLLTANKVLLGFLQEVHKCRAQNAVTLELGQTSGSSPADSATWTGALGNKSLLNVLAKQQRLTIVNGARQTKDASVRGQLYEQALLLAEALLADAGGLARAADTRRAHRLLRRQLLRPLMEDKEYERASILAEKFKDFELLVTMCVETDDMDKLYQYMDKYANEGLIEQTFTQLTESGGAGAARLLRALGPRYASRLRAWLSAAPERQELLWLHALQAGSWRAAAASAAQLAERERASLDRMMTMASLSKLLCAVCDAVPEQTLAEAERCLALAEQHKALPRELRPPGDSQAVYTHRQLALMYTAPQLSLTEYDLKKALDLAEMIEDETERDEIKLKVWCAAVLQDNWSDYSADAPLEALQDKIFFKLVDLTQILGCGPEQNPPQLSQLLQADALLELASSTDFQFLIRYGYEHLAQPVQAE